MLIRNARVLRKNTEILDLGEKNTEDIVKPTDSHDGCNKFQSRKGVGLIYPRFLKKKKKMSRTCNKERLLFFLGKP